MPRKLNEFGKQGDGRVRDTEGTWVEAKDDPPMAESPIVGEIVSVAPTVKELRFAKLVNDGADPLHAVRQVSSVGSNKAVNVRKKEAKAANELLRVCQEKMLLDLSAMAPKGLKKLESLLEAKEITVDKFGDEHVKPDNTVQLGAAKELVKLAMPGGGKGNTLSLINSVITIQND